MGFSDVTTYLNVWANLGIESIHGAMLNSYWMRKRPDSAAITVSDALFGRLKQYHINPHPYNKLGSAKGVLVGGNMSLMSMAGGTPYDIKIDRPSILFIEEVGEGMNALDRFLQQLKKSGKLDKVKAILVGNFTRITDKEDPWGIKPYDLVKTYTDELNIPIVFGFPSGHGRPNYAIYIGREVTLNVNESGADIIF
jgi:Uncharacterized proteins, homologs of microcin C7 resistance protein MccF